MAGNRWLVIDGLVIAELGNLAYLCPEFLVVHFELVGANLWRIRVELEWPPVHLKLCLCVRRRGLGQGQKNAGHGILRRQWPVAVPSLE